MLHFVFHFVFHFFSFFLFYFPFFFICFSIFQFLLIETKTPLPLEFNCFSFSFLLLYNFSFFFFVLFFFHFSVLKIFVAFCGKFPVISRMDTFLHLRSLAPTKTCNVLVKHATSQLSPQRSITSLPNLPRIVEKTATNDRNRPERALQNETRLPDAQRTPYFARDQRLRDAGSNQSSPAPRRKSCVTKRSCVVDLEPAVSLPLAPPICFANKCN